mgnify:FL=1
MTCNCKRKNPFIKAPSSKVLPRALRGFAGAGAAYLLAKLSHSKAWPIKTGKAFQLVVAGAAAQHFYPGKTAANAFAGALGYAAFASWEADRHKLELARAGLDYNSTAARSYRRRLALPEAT